MSTSDSSVESILNSIIESIQHAQKMGFGIGMQQRDDGLFDIHITDENTAVVIYADHGDEPSLPLANLPSSMEENGND